MVAETPSRFGIIGLGEVGTAFRELYEAAGREVSCHDPAQGMVGDPGSWDVVHVCVPAARVASAVMGCSKRALVIVHSTVPVGCCSALWAEGYHVAHAPVRGVHPNLAGGLRTFVMPVGAAHEVEGKDAVSVLSAIGIRAEYWGGWANTELAKLLSTTEYGLHILWMRRVADLAAECGADFHNVYTRWRQQYNEGYARLGLAHFTRPMLKPMDGKIGGHCVLPNADILAGIMDFARLVADEGREDWRQPGKPSLAARTPA